MEQLIPLINKLQDVFNVVGTDTIDLPQIVVVGSQSSGKSSVLENIVGRDFLPRGSGIVTRRPLVLQLNNIPKDPKADPRFEEWGEFLHKKNQLFYNFDEIRDEIQRETDRLTGNNKGVSAVSIGLKIYSPYVVNLTLVDLPGITKVPVGDQPTDIERQIRQMILNFITKKNSIILAVTAANTDLANSDALQLAREADPEGNRVLGVITKIDLMDKGTDALDILTGRVIPLKLGFVGVVNRSQQDINTRVPIREALKKENLFFANHPVYSSIANRCGTAFLSKTLNRILVNHIKECLPELKTRINKMMAETQAELLTYGDSIFDNEGNKGALLLTILTRFSKEYSAAVDGTSPQLSLTELHGGARINFIFQEIFGHFVGAANPLDGITETEIRLAIRNSNGPRSALFIPEGSFELLARRAIKRLEEPSLQCVDSVYDELLRIISSIQTKEIARFASLRDKVEEVAKRLLDDCRGPTKQMISNIVKLELSHINTSHPDFVGSSSSAFGALLMKLSQKDQQASASANSPNMPTGASHAHLSSSGPTQTQAQREPLSTATPGSGISKPKASQLPPQFTAKQAEDKAKHGSFLAFTSIFSPSPAAPKPAPAPAPRLTEVPPTIKPTNISDKEKFDVELISSLLYSYFEIVKKTVRDLVPKSIMFFLVNNSKENMQNQLVRQLYKVDLFDELLEESSDIADKRKTCLQIVEVLKKANDILNEVRDFSVPGK